MTKHFGLGEFKHCDTCGEMFESDPVDQNDTCQECQHDTFYDHCVQQKGTDQWLAYLKKEQLRSERDELR